MQKSAQNTPPTCGDVFVCRKTSEPTFASCWRPTHQSSTSRCVLCTACSMVLWEACQLQCLRFSSSAQVQTTPALTHWLNLLTQHWLTIGLQLGHLLAKQVRLTHGVENTKGICNMECIVLLCRPRHMKRWTALEKSAALAAMLSSCSSGRTWRDLLPAQVPARLGGGDV